MATHLKQVAFGAAGSVLALVIITIAGLAWGFIRDGRLIHHLGGATQANLATTQADLATTQADLATAQTDLATTQRTPILEGVVVAFDTPGGCPKGWSELSDAVGKVIIGAGLGDTYPYRVSGGKEYIDLTEQHIPAHVHGYTDAYFSESNNRRPRGSERVAVPGKKGLKGDVDTNNVGWAVTRKTGSFGYEGENRIRHTNMQPYIAFHFCVFKPS